MNIVEYIQQYGHKTLDEMPLNAVDSLILSQLSYLKFDGLLPGIKDRSKGITLKKISHAEKTYKLFKDKRYAEANKSLFYAASASKRFGEALFRDYINIIDEDWAIQFSAVTVKFPNGTTYIAFRGTDDNMVGWQEDLDMIYKTPIPAQEKSVEYLLYESRKIKGKFYVGGHSKGGNLAVYSAMTIHKRIQKRIELIYSHDGPGFRNEVIEKSNFDNIESKIVKLVPKSSIVGMLMTTKEPYEVVLCQKKGIQQHDPFNWIIEGSDFVKADKVDKIYMLNNKAVNLWALNLTSEQGEYLSKELFEIIGKAGITSMNDLQANYPGLVSSMKNLALTVNEIDEETRNNLEEILRGLVEIIHEVMKEDLIENVNSTLENAKAVVDNVIEGFHVSELGNALYKRKKDK